MTCQLWCPHCVWLRVCVRKTMMTSVKRRVSLMASRNSRTATPQSLEANRRCGCGANCGVDGVASCGENREVDEKVCQRMLRGSVNRMYRPSVPSSCCFGAQREVSGWKANRPHTAEQPTSANEELTIRLACRKKEDAWSGLSTKKERHLSSGDTDNDSCNKALTCPKGQSAWAVSLFGKEKKLARCKTICTMCSAQIFGRLK